jgi:tetratricopeptide (TPR) repeat protein
MEEARTALAIAPDHWHTRWCIAWIYLSQAMYDEAIPWIQEALQLSGQGIDVLASLGNAYGAAGSRDEALGILDRLNQRAKRGYVPSAAFAQIHAGLGERDEAFAWLEKAYEERSPWLLHVWLPIFASLHADPRYEDLLRRMDYPASRIAGKDER